MTIFDMPNYLWITILAMILLTVFCTLVLHKWFSAAIITFVVLALLAFFIPNFHDFLSTFIRLCCLFSYNEFNHKFLIVVLYS